MTTSFTKIAQANVDMYNEHPVIHTATLAVYALAATFVTRRIAKRILKDANDLRSVMA